MTTTKIAYKSFVRLGLVSTAVFVAACGAEGLDVDERVYFAGLGELAHALTDEQDTPVPGPSVGAKAPVVSDIEQVVEQTEEEALALDLELVAEAKGWTIDEAAADRIAADAVGEVAVEIAKDSPNIFVGSAVSPEPGGTPSLFIKGGVDATVLALVARSAVEIRIVDEQPFSFTELEERQHRVQRALAESGVVAVTMFHLEREGLIEAEVEEDVEASLEELSELLPEDLRDTVELRFVPGDNFSRESIFGGMTAQDGGVFECTTGWAVRNGAGLEGVTTAGHCDGIDQVVDPAVGTESVSHVAQHLGAFGDIEWKREVGNDSQLDDFYATPTAIRDTSSVEAIANISEGESICVFGRATGSRVCSADVDAVSVSCLGVNRLVRMDAHVTTFGDSGSGWSWNNRAYGAHVGNCSGSVFTAADHFDSALGVNVMISP